jgi:hypothetical protein
MMIMIAHGVEERILKIKTRGVVATAAVVSGHKMIDQHLYRKLMIWYERAKKGLKFFLEAVGQVEEVAEAKKPQD